MEYATEKNNPMETGKSQNNDSYILRKLGAKELQTSSGWGSYSSE